MYITDPQSSLTFRQYCILLPRDNGREKHDIAYEGMTTKMLFRMVSFPAVEINREAQLAVLCLTLSMIRVKEIFFLLTKLFRKNIVPSAKRRWIIRGLCLAILIPSPTIFQFSWKKLAEKPSGPGALSL